MKRLLDPPASANVRRSLRTSFAAWVLLSFACIGTIDASDNLPNVGHAYDGSYALKLPLGWYQNAIDPKYSPKGIIQVVFDRPAGADGAPVLIVFVSTSAAKKERLSKFVKRKIAESTGEDSYKEKSKRVSVLSAGPNVGKLYQFIGAKGNSRYYFRYAARNHTAVCFKNPLTLCQNILASLAPPTKAGGFKFRPAFDDISLSISHDWSIGEDTKETLLLLNSRKKESVFALRTSVLSLPFIYRVQYIRDAGMRRYAANLCSSAKGKLQSNLSKLQRVEIRRGAGEQRQLIGTLEYVTGKCSTSSNIVSGILATPKGFYEIGATGKNADPLPMIVPILQSWR